VWYRWYLRLSLECQSGGVEPDEQIPRIRLSDKASRLCEHVVASAPGLRVWTTCSTTSPGVSHDPETHLIPLVLDAASGRRPHVTIFGTDYGTPDGTCLRDYIHVSDLAVAHVLALDRLLTGAASDVFNLGNGQGFSVRQVVDTVGRITGLKVPVKLGDRRPGDPAALVSDATRAHDMLGWRPRLHELDEIVRTAWAWHQRAMMRPQPVSDSEKISA
jgi:UDP-glucose 4-epimerase